MTTYPAPKDITFLQTFKCSASCKNCCFGCRPTRGKSLSAEEMIRYLDLGRKVFGPFTGIQFSGGECMLNYDDVLKTMKYAYDKYYLLGTFLSNCFWATSRETARDKLKTLYDAGMRTFVPSTGDEHQETVPLRKCMDAILEAVNVGYSVNLRVEFHHGMSDTMDVIHEDEELGPLLKSGKVKLERYDWMDFNNEEIQVGSYKYKQVRMEPKPCESLMKDLIISPYGDVFACCGIACSRIPFLRLGSLNTDNLSDIWIKGFNDALKLWLIVEGPSGVMKYVEDNTRIPFPSASSRCDICLNLFTDKRVIPFLKATYHDWFYRVKYKFDKIDRRVKYEKK